MLNYSFNAEAETSDGLTTLLHFFFNNIWHTVLLRSPPEQSELVKRNCLNQRLYLTVVVLG